MGRADTRTSARSPGEREPEPGHLRGRARWAGRPHSPRSWRNRPRSSRAPFYRDRLLCQSSFFERAQIATSFEGGGCNCRTRRMNRQKKPKSAVFKRVGLLSARRDAVQAARLTNGRKRLDAGPCLFHACRTIFRATCTATCMAQIRPAVCIACCPRGRLPTPRASVVYFRRAKANSEQQAKDKRARAIDARRCEPLYGRVERVQRSLRAFTYARRSWPRARHRKAVGGRRSRVAKANETRIVCNAAVSPTILRSRVNREG